MQNIDVHPQLAFWVKNEQIITEKQKTDGKKTNAGAQGQRTRETTRLMEVAR